MKIAVYCRVSTDKEEQKSSLKHQKEYLKSLYPMMKDKLVPTLEEERDFKKC